MDEILRELGARDPGLRNNAEAVSAALAKQGIHSIVHYDDTNSALTIQIAGRDTNLLSVIVDDFDHGRWEKDAYAHFGRR